MQDISFCDRYTEVPSISKERITECFSRGFSIEDKFIEIMRKRGHGCEKCSVQDDFRHKDVAVYVNGDRNRKVTVDVKAKRKLRSCDTKVSEDFTFLELVNVNGKSGSVMGGEDAMAFEYGDGFILAGTNNLRNMLKERFGSDFMETKGYMKSYTVKYPMMVPEPYTIYKRNGRDDRIVLVRLDDVKKIGKIID